MTERYAITTTALTKRYGQNLALKGINIGVETGTVFGVIGPNGAGKTTLMRLLLDIIRPTSGDLEVLGQHPREGGPMLRTNIGYLPGELRLETRIRGRDFLKQLERISGPVAPGRVAQLAKRLDVDLSQPVRSLSKGNKQKLGLIQAFMHEPRLLVLDEPTSGLDPLVQQEFLAMVAEEHAKGQTVVLSSHVLSEVQQAAHRVAIVRAGQIVALSTVDQLREQAQRRVRIQVAPDAEPALRAELAMVSGLQLDVGSAGTLEARLEGGVDELIRVLAHHNISNLVIEEPDLEEAVLGFYAKQEQR